MKCWNEVWIIGGGPSAHDFDLSLLRDQTVLAVNDAIFLYPLADAVFSIDANWVHRHKDFLAGFKNEKYVALPLETYTQCADIPGVQYLRWSQADGLSDNPDVVCTGCNSGYAAINLVYHKCARLVHLIGYDMNPDGRHTQYPFWAPLFNNMLRQLRCKGITVLNHNMNSAITAFERIRL